MKTDSPGESAAHSMTTTRDDIENGVKGVCSRSQTEFEEVKMRDPLTSGLVSSTTDRSTRTCCSQSPCVLTKSSWESSGLTWLTLRSTFVTREKRLAGGITGGVDSVITTRVGCPSLTSNHFTDSIDQV